ncbi:MAG: hypothetical protein JRE64_21420, partial [Deltaproteobacteria bacterium]|nr:hypothetical protein [Deltaproteobacteria bacterium]
RVRELDEAWIRVWQPVGITQLSPKEMSGWLAEMDKLRFKVSDIFKKEQEIGRDVKQRKDLNQAVQKELNSMGEDGTSKGRILIRRYKKSLILWERMEHLPVKSLVLF